MTAADRIIRWSTALAVLGVAAIAAVVSYEHAGDLVRAHGETGWTARLIPLTVDGLIYASSMVMLDSARRGARVPTPAPGAARRRDDHTRCEPDRAAVGTAARRGRRSRHGRSAGIAVEGARGPQARCWNDAARACGRARRFPHDGRACRDGPRVAG